MVTQDQDPLCLLKTSLSEQTESASFDKVTELSASFAFVIDESAKSAVAIEPSNISSEFMAPVAMLAVPTLPFDADVTLP